MRLSFRKTLATVLSILMVLSTFVGVLSVSAEAVAVGTLTIEDVTAVANADNTFDVVANIALNEAREYVEVAYKLGDLPKGVTLTSVSADAEIHNGNIIYVSAAAAQNVAVTMTFTATNTEPLAAFKLSVSKVVYADVGEEDETITIGGPATITITNHAPKAEISTGDSVYHWYACQVEDCTDHQYNKDWHRWQTSTTKEPTCSSTGTKQYVCSCGRNYTEDIAAKEHNYEYTDNEDGATHTKTCSVGGETATEAHVYVDGLCACGAEEVTECAHEYDEAITKAPTCKEDGVKTFTCKKCGDTYTEAIDATGHTEGTPVDNEDGATHTVPCSVCGEAVRTEDHNYVDGTCGCGAVEETECVHEAAANRTVVIADGSYTYNTICTVCGEVINTETVTNEDSAVVSNTVAGFASYAAIEMTEAGTATVPFAGTGSVKVAYVDGAKVMASNGLNTAYVTAYDPVSVTVADGIATIDSTKTGIIIVFTLADSTNLDKVLTSHNVGVAFVLESSISMALKIQKNTNYTNVGFDTQYIEVVRHGYVKSTPTDFPSTLTEFEAKTSSIDFALPLAAMQLGDSIDAYYYGVKDGVSYLIRASIDAGMITYAASSTIFDSTNTSQKKLNEKILIANILKYAGEAQEYFDYNNSDDGSTLAYNNPKVKDSVNSILAANPSKVFTTEEINTYKAHASDDTPKMTTNSANAIFRYGRSLNLEDKIEMNLKFDMSRYLSDSTTNKIEDLSFQVTYYNSETETTETKDLTDEEIVYNENQKMFVYLFDEYAANQMDTKVTVTILHNGEYYASSDYSIYSYVANNYNSTSKKGTTTLGDLCKTIGAYGYAAKVNFG